MGLSTILSTKSHCPQYLEHIQLAFSLGTWIIKSGLFQLNSLTSHSIQKIQILREDQVGKLHKLLNDDIKRKIYMFDSGSHIAFS